MDTQIKHQRGQLQALIINTLRSAPGTQADIAQRSPGLNPLSISNTLYRLKGLGRVAVAGKRGRETVWRFVEGSERIVITAQQRALAGTIPKRIDKILSELTSISEESKALKTEAEKLREENKLLRSELKGRLVNALTN